MSSNAVLECVPNFSEGRDPAVIRAITDEIETVEGVRLLDVDPGKATNRTVVTFVGGPEAVVEAAFRAIQRAAQLIDMRRHEGEHPRMGATDVCPLVPVSGIDVAEAVEWARRLGQRVGDELGIPVFLYEYAATVPERRNLATIRAGEYEGLADKMQQAAWRPDFGPAAMNVQSGATVIGVRDFLVAYNINLNTTSTRRANAVAFDVREQGRVKKSGKTAARGEDGEPIRIPGTLKAVKAIGWYIEEYGIAQVSMNLTNLNITPLHVAFEEGCRSAEARGMRVTGSELVGLVPLQSLVEAGRYFLRKQRRSAGVGEAELVRIAVRSLGLGDLAPFDVDQKVIEYRLRDAAAAPLAGLSLTAFAGATASESPAPGGGSVAAYVGALGVALGTMVANLSAQGGGREERWEAYSDWAEAGQRHLKRLLELVDEDTAAFNAVMSAMRLPRATPEEAAARELAMQAATHKAIETPLAVMRAAVESMAVMAAMAELGNSSSVSDAGVGALCARAAVRGAMLNVEINLPGLLDIEQGAALRSEGIAWMDRAEAEESRILAQVAKVMGGEVVA